jgi:hypothetical protein
MNFPPPFRERDASFYDVTSLSSPSYDATSLLLQIFFPFSFCHEFCDACVRLNA